MNRSELGQIGNGRTAPDRVGAMRVTLTERFPLMGG
jgi:hypothetical protein